jgi:hypothetical protein
MEISETLEADIRDRILNWRTRRGTTPFYSGLFWPPRVSESEKSQSIADAKSLVTPLPSVLMLTESIHPDQIESARFKYPEADAALQKLYEVVENSRHVYCSSDEVFFKRVKLRDKSLASMAFELEFFSRKSQTTELDIRNLALKLDAYISTGNSGISIKIPSTRGIENILRVGSAESHLLTLKVRIWRKSDMGFIWKCAEGAIPASNFEELSMYCADIVSQGTKSLVLTDMAGSQFILSDVGDITSVAEMDEVLLRRLPTYVHPEEARPKARKYEFFVRPYADIEAGVRFFIRHKKIIASTPMSRSEALRSDQMIDGRVGKKLIKSDSIRTRTEFESATEDSKIFARLRAKAEEIVAATPEDGVQNYALDVLLTATDRYVVDVADFLSVDYFDLNPSAMFKFDFDQVLEQIFDQNEPKFRLNKQEFMHLMRGKLSREQIICLLGRGNPLFEERTVVTPASLIISGRVTHDSLVEFINSVCKMRSLLIKDRVKSKSKSGIDIKDQVDELAQSLGILPDDLDKYYIEGFVRAMVADFKNRCQGRPIKLIVSDLLARMPLMEAIKWYRGLGDQTWGYKTLPFPGVNDFQFTYGSEVRGMQFLED